jgi:hypothetical protein
MACDRIIYVRQARAEAHIHLYIQAWIHGVGVWVRGHDDIQATYNGIVRYRILQVAGHLGRSDRRTCYGPLGPPGPLRAVTWIQYSDSAQKAHGPTDYMRGECTGGGDNISGFYSSWTPGVFRTYFYNHAHRLRLEKLL